VCMLDAVFIKVDALHSYLVVQFAPDLMSDCSYKILLNPIGRILLSLPSVSTLESDISDFEGGNTSVTGVNVSERG